MFESLTESLSNVFRKLGGRGTLTEQNVQEGLREVRMALLAADVHFKVAKEFIDKVTQLALGQDVLKSVNPSQQIVKLVHDEMIRLMSAPETPFPWNSKGPTVVMLAGLQGSGKTTTCAKLARWFSKKGKSPLLVAADTQRPAAVEQLKVLGKQLGIPVHSEEGGRPPKICERALGVARETGRDLVILDTAGRLHIDQALMDEVKEIADRTKPQQIYLVCDAMTGQDAVTSAKEFNDKLPLDGVILTKLDGDAKGGAALSVRAITGKPIRFVGMGEKIDELEEFHPDRLVGRILGMGDIVTLVEKAQETMDVEKAEKLQQKLRKADLNFEDFLDQLAQMKKMGPLKNLLAMIPGMGGMADQVDESEFKRIEAIVQSMTLKERRDPELIDGSRRSRIAKGSGTSVQEVNSLLKQFRDMRKMLKGMGKFKKMMGGKFGGMPGMGGMGGMPGMGGMRPR
ncbi:MAG: signal recognition particle protein [Planctomycetes bacterium]|nr:signal recognition particle protein [Planctomycetota bacterium]